MLKNCATSILEVSESTAPVSEILQFLEILQPTDEKRTSDLVAQVGMERLYTPASKNHFLNKDLCVVAKKIVGLIDYS